jgi:glyoxylase-like metal-dependent hydrolase (beta-lactamase superfamily II)
MNRRLVLAAVLLAALAGAYVHGQLTQKPSTLDVVKIADDLFVIHNEFVPGNTTVLVTNEGVVLVDDKFEVDFDNILAQVKTITPQPVRYVINTHHHGDHTGGNARFRAMNVPVVASEKAWQHMSDARMPGQPTITYDERGYVHLGGKRIELHYFGRAHTNGDTFVYFPEHRTLAAGDAFTFGDATPQFIDYASGGSAKEWTRTLDSALQLDFDTVVPGHGTVTTKAELRRFRDTTLSVRTKVRDMIVGKKTRDEILKMLQADFKWGQLQFTRSLDGLIAELQ